MRRHGAPERRSGGHVAGATTTTAGVRRRAGAAGPAPAPRPGFPAAGGRAGPERARVRSLAGSVGAQSLRARLGAPRRPAFPPGCACEGRAGSASWELFLLLASPPLAPPLNPANGFALCSVPSWRRAGAKKALAEGSRLLNVHFVGASFLFEHS